MRMIYEVGTTIKYHMYMHIDYKIRNISFLKRIAIYLEILST